MVTYAEYAPTVAYSFVLYFPPKKQKKHTLVTCSVLADFLSSASARQTNLSFGRWLLSNMWQLCIHCQDEYLVNLSPSATQSAIASALLGPLSPCAQLSRIPPKTSFFFVYTRTFLRFSKFSKLPIPYKIYKKKQWGCLLFQINVLPLRR